MKHGAFNVILKADDRVCNGNSRYPNDPHPPKKALMSKSQILIIFFDIKDTVPFEVIPQGHTVNQAYSVELVKLFVKLCVERRPEFLPYD
jgi:hypothetical protein